MPKSKASIDEEQYQDLLALKDDVAETRQETAEIREELLQLRQEMQTIHLKNDGMHETLSDVQTTMRGMGLQLNALADVLRSLHPQQQTTTRPERPEASSQQNPPGALPIPKSPTLKQAENEVRPLTAALRERLAQEQQRSENINALTSTHLPPINTGRRSAPPGFGRPTLADIQSGQVTPRATPRMAKTPVFHYFQPPEVRAKMEKYYQTYAQDMQAQFMKSITKGPRMDFPRFDGQNPTGWIRQCEKYFQMAGAPTEYKVSLSQLYIVGRADVWLRRSGLLKKKLTWERFCKEILYRFSATSSYDLADRFNSLKQNTMTVSDYTDMFEDLMAEIQEECPELTESWFVKCYVNGLRHSIKFQLRPLRPVSLTEAYWLAVDMEHANPVKKSFSSYNSNVKPTYTGFRQTQTSVEKPLEGKQLPHLQKQKEANKCWRCGDNWFHGHKCKQQPVINLLTGEEMERHQDIPEGNQETEEQATEEENCMQISLQAMSAVPVNTISIILHIGGKQAVALIDTGSTSTFMNLQFALKTSCKILQDDMRAVKVAGGGKLWSGGYIDNTPFTINRESYKYSFRVLDLPGQDVVLGSDWLAQYSPVGFDYNSRALLLVKDGKQIAIPACDTLDTATEIQAHELDKIISKGATGFVIHSLNDCSDTTMKAVPLPQEIEQLLQQYVELFNEPHGLPPVRACDHSIPLQENAIPPNTRPYRVPQKHKE
jgi:hypothetical protein